MKKYASFLFALVATLHSVFGQRPSYPFEVAISGHGRQAIIFIPGFASSGDVWNDTELMYEKNYTCHVLTMAGFAGATPQPNPTFNGWKNAIADYIRDTKINKPIVIGHSMGGALAMALASDYPDLLSKIVVVDGLPCLSALMNPGFKTNEKNDCSQMVSQVTAASDEQFYQMQKATVAYMVADTSKHKQVLNWSLQSDKKTFAQMYCDFSNTDLREKIEAIKCPSLILLEAQFANMKPTINDQFKNLETADIRYSAKGLHFIMFDDQSWFEQELSSFIDSK